MAIKVITPPAALLTAAELNLHLKLDSATATADATLVSACLMAAHRYAEHYTQVSLGSQTLELALDAFPDGPIELPRGPVTGVTSVQYIDTVEDEITLDSSAYGLDDYSVPAWLTVAYGTEWPDTLDTVNAVKVRYVAGAATLDEAVRAALLLIVGHLYANRENVAPGNLSEVPMGANVLLDTVKVWQP